MKPAPITHQGLCPKCRRKCLRVSRSTNRHNYNRKLIFQQIVSHSLTLIWSLDSTVSKKPTVSRQSDVLVVIVKNASRTLPIFYRSSPLMRVFQILVLRAGAFGERVTHPIFR